MLSDIADFCSEKAAKRLLDCLNEDTDWTAFMEKLKKKSQK
jgi:hypothetical protein